MRLALLAVISLAAAAAAPTSVEITKMVTAARKVVPWHHHAIVKIQHGHNNGTRSNQTTSANECEELYSRMGLKMSQNPTCMALAEHMNSMPDNPTSEDIQTLCGNACLEDFVADMELLAAANCIYGFDPSFFNLMCDASLCTTPEAKACVTEWLSLGCPEDAELFQRCDAYAGCAFAAQQNGGCVKPSPSPVARPQQPVRNCTHLNNCSGKGHCSANSTCVCDKGYGRTSPNVRQDCSEYIFDLCPNQCRGHGSCYVKPSGEFACHCNEGFSGSECETWTRCEELGFCSGHGTCTRSDPFDVTPVQCICDVGFHGTTCQTRRDTCPNMCSGRGSCNAGTDGSRVCECDRGYEGEECAQVVDICPLGCSGFGKCQSDGNCTCASFASGPGCSRIVNQCQGGCGHGHCRDGTCECLPHFTGAQCNEYEPQLDTLCKGLNFCSGMGVCNHADGTATCTCFDGFTGRDCSIIDTASHCPGHCSGHGRCVLLPSPRCECDAHWEGEDCMTSTCPTNADGRVCSAHGICENSTCTCDSGFSSGDLGACEHTSCPNDCSGHGSCSAVTNECTCDSGFDGTDCSDVVEATPTPTPDPESSDEVSCLNNCSGHGVCNDGVCGCVDGFTGVDCSISPSLPEEEDDDIGLLVQFGEGVDSDATPTSKGAMSHLWD